MSFIWIEILKFIKNNIFKIIMGTAILAGLFVFSSYDSSSSNVENVEEIQQEERFKPDAKPANFYFYVMNDEGTSFTNDSIIERYLLRTDLLEETSNNTNTNLTEIIKQTENNAVVDYKETGETKVLGIERDGTTHLNEFYINIGNEEDNLAIANEYYGLIFDGNVPFFETKEVYSFQEPKVKEIEDVVSEDTTSKPTVNEKIIDIIQDIIVGILLGFVFTNGILLVLTFITKKIQYSFSYTIKEKDYFLLVDKKLNNDNEVNEILTTPTHPKKVIIREDSNKLTIDEQIKNIDFVNNIKQYNSFLDIENIDEIDQLIYILEEGTTTREWYNKQRNLDKFLEIPSVVIQVNKNMRNEISKKNNMG